MLRPEIGHQPQIAETALEDDFPFDLDLVFAPDGIESFEAAWRNRVETEGFPVCHPDDIINSKAAARRAKDLESLPRLRAFRDYWKARR